MKRLVIWVMLLHYPALSEAQRFQIETDLLNPVTIPFRHGTNYAFTAHLQWNLSPQVAVRCDYMNWLLASEYSNDASVETSTIRATHGGRVQFKYYFAKEATIPKTRFYGTAGFIFQQVSITEKEIINHRYRSLNVTKTGDKVGVCLTLGAEVPISKRFYWGLNFGPGYAIDMSSNLENEEGLFGDIAVALERLRFSYAEVIIGIKL